ncbi:MAG: hypothetical protein AAF333_00010 [Planctomycetota bacterium]
MAKKSNNNQSNESNNGKVKVFYAEAEASSEGIIEIMRTVANLRQPVIVQAPPARQIETPNNLTETIEAPLFNDVNDDSTEGDNANTGLDDSESSARQPRGTGPKVDRNAHLNKVPDIDFANEGGQSLKVLFEEKKPKTDINKVLVISHYLQDIIKISYGVNEIYTGLGHLSQRVPKDLPATIRNMKRDALIKYSKIDDIQLATEGANRVKLEMPGTSAE